MTETVVLYRPTGPDELALVEQSGFRRWPPRLPGQPIFYPVTNEAYAVEIASKWNVHDSGEGYVTRFRVRAEFMERYDIHKVGGQHHTEWWIPAGDLEALNDNIVGSIEVVRRFGRQTTTYTLRPATLADLEPMMAVGHEGIRPYVEQLWGWDADAQELAFRAHFVPELVSIIVVDGHDAGYIKVQELPDHLFLEGIYIGAAHRNRGLGHAVVTDLVARAHAQGKPLRLRVLRPNPARHLYQRLGFRDTASDDEHFHMESTP